MTAAREYDKSPFSLNKTLLNSHFEAYKLDVTEYNSTTYRLPSQVSYQTHRENDILGFQELKDSHNQQRLVPGSNRGHLAYIDDAGFVVLVVLNKASRPSFQPLYNIFSSSSPRGDEDDGAASTSSSSAPPSLCSLDAGQWLVCNGSNTLDLLSTQRSPSTQRWSADVKRSFKVTTSPPGSKGCRLLEARINDEASHTLALVQHARKDSTAADPSSDTSKPKPTTRAVFDVSLLRLPLSDTGDSDAQVERIRTVTGSEPVYYSILSGDIDGPHVLVAEDALRSSGDEPVQRDTSQTMSSTLAAPPSKRQRASSPRPPPPARPPPFSWLQTPDSVTVIFQLPPTLLKTDFRIHFSQQGLSLSLASDALDRHQSAKIIELDDDATLDAASSDPLQDTAVTIANGTFSSRSLWAPIDPSHSVWTWEKVGSGVKQPGLLTLHLEKKDEGTRWVRVFEQHNKIGAGTENASRPMIGGDHSATRKTDEERLREHEIEEQHSDDDDESHPPETIDPSELLSMVEGLDKYTTDGRGDEEAISRPGGIDEVSRQRESLLHDALEPEDAIVGRRAVLTASTGNGVQDTLHQEHTYYSLAESIPSATSTAQALVIRQELDGLVCVHASSGSAVEQWTHKDTVPALSFVLASKRDMSRVYVHFNERTNSSTVLAFESAPRVGGGESSGAGAGNLFVYYSETRKRHGRSRVIRLGARDGEHSGSGEDTGALMGVALASWADDSTQIGNEAQEHVLVCLCERSVILLTGML